MDSQIFEKLILSLDQDFCKEDQITTLLRGNCQAALLTSYFTKLTHLLATESRLSSLTKGCLKAIREERWFIYCVAHLINVNPIQIFSSYRQSRYSLIPGRPEHKKLLKTISRRVVLLLRLNVLLSPIMTVHLKTFKRV